MKRLNKLVLGISFLFLVISITAGCGMGKKRKLRKVLKNVEYVSD